MKILVLGATGMIGHAMFNVLHDANTWDVYGTARNSVDKNHFSNAKQKQIVLIDDIQNHNTQLNLFSKIMPNIVINCIGLTKHYKEANDPLCAIAINATLPHQISALCKLSDARLVHISTDCVFTGEKGNYVEHDKPDAIDLYGKTKEIGETTGPSYALTLRTSTIGHELHSKLGLLEWFLSQQGRCNGFRRAIFSGLPNTVFAEVVRDFVIPNPNLYGLYHVGAEPINKYKLLQLIAMEYKKQIDIIPNNEVVIDRSLDCDSFMNVTGYKAPPWPELLHKLDPNKIRHKNV
ncbi:SDR family oxidoreductase [Lentilitoribacter sp. Alg239-R112]|uniref:dTDP-4-dehydrorhamnose reductase family protein n=1 Tax=Lentilitoribacter sp. Alg239-R112 TaxID=2305987 RepID=UPI0013A6965D|nr:SDR family oxidoreductase [Lentilitoribacter sp. Alg239-R112]